MLNTLLIRPGSISILYTHSDKWSAVPQLTFLPHGHHLAGSLSWPESATKTKCEDYARDQHQTNHGDAWPADQIMALSAASSGMVYPKQSPMFNSLNTYNAVPTTKCSDAVTKRNLMFGILSLAHTNNRRQRKHQTDLNIPSQIVMITWLVQALIEIK